MVAKLTYASSVWIGFSSANDRQKITAFIWRSKRTGFCSSQLDDFSSLCDAADTRLFTEILHNPCHVLQALFTPPADHNYNLWYRPHNRQLPDRMSYLTNSNFIVRMLFCESYWLYWLYSLFTFYRLVFYRCLHVCLQLRIDSCSIKETFDLILLKDLTTFAIDGKIIGRQLWMNKTIFIIASLNQ